MSAPHPVWRFAFRVALFVPLMLLMAAVSWHYDPGYLFRRAGEKPLRRVAQLLLSGHAVTLSDWNIDERLVMRYYVEQMWPWQAPDVLVIGSSRAMRISSSGFRGHTFFNAGVSGASLEDDIAITQLFVERGFVPHTVILGLDPWLVNRNNLQPRWVTLSEEYNRGVRRITKHSRVQAWEAPLATMKQLELVSPAYFQASLMLATRLAPESGATKNASVTVAIADENSTETIRYSDGSVRDAARRLSKSVAAVRAEAVGYAAEQPAYSLGSFTAIDPALSSLFEQYVDDLLARGVTPVFFLPPYHPATYELLVANPKYRILTEVENYFRHVAASRGIAVYCSYDPARCQLVEGDFFDGMHTRRETAETIFFALRERLKARGIPSSH